MRVLIVEDEVLIRKYVSGLIRSLGYEVAGETSSGEVAIALVDKEDPDLVLMDIRLAGEIDGIEAAKSIASRHAKPIAFMSAYPYENIVNANQIPCVYGFLNKPLAASDILPILKAVEMHVTPV